VSLPAAALARREERSPTRFLIPCYFTVPDGKVFWDSVIKAHSSKSEVIAIMNVGAGTVPAKETPVSGGPLIPAGWDQQVTQKHYDAVLAAAGKAGVRVLGYVSTRLGERPAKQVLADIAAYKKMWPSVSGIFLDEGPIGTPDKPNRAADALTAYKGYRAEAIKLFGENKNSDADPRVVVNFGNVGSKPEQLKDYLTDGKNRSVADILVMFESTDLSKYNQPAWVTDFAASRFSTLLYQTTDPKLLSAVREKVLGNVYITDKAGDNPWDGLPKYWDKEVQLVREQNGDKP
jgi:hypothetical protein